MTEAKPPPAQQSPGSRVLQNGGFRLDRFEVFNWGTFDQQVWQMSPQQHNALLTGNIGSGKSTLVDGLTTLLVPTRQLAFNKAAGAVEKERSLGSYFHGVYTSQQDEYGKARAVGLRKTRHYSVLLAQFSAQALAETVTIAQVLWLKPGESKVRRLFVVATEALFVSRHFCAFGSQISQLKKQLRRHDSVQLFDSFGPYSQAFSKLLGLGSDGKALALFNQTISMKSVGSVTDFVRHNMLEQPDVAQQLQQLEHNYDALKRLHDAVLDARRKVELLTPVSNYGDEAIDAATQKEQVNQCRDLSEGYMAKIAIGLYRQRLVQREQALQKLDIQLAKLEKAQQDVVLDITQVKQDILNNGGGRLQQLKNDIARISGYRDNSRKLYHNYETLVKALQLPAELQPGIFVENIGQAKDLLEQAQNGIEQLEEQAIAQRLERQQPQQQQQQIGEQLAALKLRKSNITLKQLNIRELICRKLKIDESRLPFVGELLQVKSSAGLFQGAIERVLHGFALSLMVPDDLYRPVSDIIEQTRLDARLVYYRIQPPQGFFPAAIEPRSLPGNIEIKPDTEHYEWLQKELHQRFNYICCDHMNDFRRNEKAITPNGQIKSGRFRHEKDDRHNIHDQSRYVLGWSNKEKIRLLQQQTKKLQQQLNDIDRTIAGLKQQRQQLDKKRISALNLADFDFTFEQLNWPLFSRQIEQLQQEKHSLEQSSDRLRDLQQQLEALEQQLAPAEAAVKEKYRQQGGKQQEIVADRAALVEQQQCHDALGSDQIKQYFPTLDQFYRQYIDKPQIRIAELGNLASRLRGKLNDRVQHLEEKRRKKESRMIAAMADFGHEFPNDVAEIDKSIQALAEYQQILTRLSEEDLPRHEARFKEMLNRDTIRAMALFRSQLDRQEEDIDARVRLINSALHKLDYQAGTYIEIDAVAAPDVEVRDFRQRLKLCVEFAADDNLYSEEKFVRVKDLIEQMRNEPKWTQKVVDVRYWHLFNVIERYREDHSEKECYSDSGGKSGGQKEKLAYSILAAAILLQYRLVSNNDPAGDPADNPASHSKRRRFNLVVIDEAFARGSKDSTRFGLELFKQLGLQLLLVTPLQKLDVIEHYVKQVHFVDQQDNRSMLLNMTIEEYRERLAQHKQLKHDQMPAR